MDKATGTPPCGCILYGVVQRPMDATFATQDQGLEILLPSLEYEARLRKQEIEGRLGVRN